jgi:hypothetical protein
MMITHQYEQFRKLVEPAIQSKAEELSILGYGVYQEDQIWSFLISKKWKKPKSEIRLYEIIDDILSMKPGEFMSFQTIEALKSAQTSLPSEEDWKELLK